MEVRPVDHRDAALATVIVRIQQRAYAVEADLIRFAAIPNLRESATDVQHLDLTFAAAFDDGQMAGFVGYRRDEDVVDIDRLAVDPVAFRRGVATAMLRFVIDREGSADYLVSTGRTNTPAVKLYESLGFRPVAERVIDAGLTVVQLRRPSGLGPPT